MNTTMTMQADSYPMGLRYLIILGTLGAFATGIPAVFLPTLVVALTGLSAEAIPAMQQAGAITIGFGVGGVFCLRAANWNEVRITVIASLASFALTTVGAFYYVVLQGVATPGLILILVVAVVMTLGYGYYVWHYAQRGEVM